jgi:chaperonin GroES
MLRALADRIVVNRNKSDLVTEGGIFIPENFADKADSGTVLSVGPGKRIRGQLKGMTVKTGDTVIFQKLAGTTVEVDKTEYLILRPEDIMGIVKLADE